MVIILIFLAYNSDLLAGAVRLAEVVTVNTGDDREALETGARLVEQSRMEQSRVKWSRIE